MDTLENAYTCAACRKRTKKVYSYYGPGNGVKLCSKTCRESYIQYKREEAQARARKRAAQASTQAAAPAQRKTQGKAQTQRKTQGSGGFRLFGFKVWGQ